MIRFKRGNRNDGDLCPNRRIAIREGLYLGGYHEGDQATLVKYLNDADVYNNTINIPHPYTSVDARWWIEHIQKEDRRLGLQPNWTIRHAEDGLVGGIGMVINGDAIEAYQEIGYWLAKPYRRLGIMSDVIKVLTDHCFKKYKEIEAITAHIFEDNKASQATIKKAGFHMTRLIDDYYQKEGLSISAYEFVLERP